MMRKFTIGLVIAVVLLGALASAAAAEHSQVPVMRFHAQTDIAAPAASVWAHLTSGKNLVTWCPEWKSPKNAAVNLTKVGDTLDYTDDWGGGGRSVVTYIVKDRELRVAHEPNKGDYMCQAKLILTPTAGGTKVDYWEQYTDESAPADMQATAAKMEAEMAATLATVKKGCEMKK
jgi:uncharacterized protein YndB with AHSA1/START domain